MKKATKKQKSKLKSIQVSYLNTIKDAKKLVIELLSRNGDPLRIPKNMLNNEMCINVYGKYGCKEYFFVGASFVNDELYLLGFNQDTDKEEIISPGYYDRTDLIDVAQYLISYLNDEIEINEEFEEE